MLADKPTTPPPSLPGRDFKYIREHVFVTTIDPATGNQVITVQPQ